MYKIANYQSEIFKGHKYTSFITLHLLLFISYKMKINKIEHQTVHCNTLLNTNIF